MNTLKATCLVSMSKIPAWEKLQESERLALMVAFLSGSEEVLVGFRQIVEDGGIDTLPKFIDKMLRLAEEWREELKQDVFGEATK